MLDTSPIALYVVLFTVSVSPLKVPYIPEILKLFIALVLVWLDAITAVVAEPEL